MYTWGPINRTAAASPFDSAYGFDFVGSPSPQGTSSESGQVSTWTSIDPSTNRSQFTVTAISGKKYCELELVSKSSNLVYQFIGVGKKTDITLYNATNYAAFSRRPETAGGCGLGASGYTASGSLTTSTSYDYAPGDRIGVAMDTATGKVWYSKNGTWISGDPGAGTGQTSTVSAGTYYFVAGIYTCNTGAATTSVVKVYPHAGGQLSSPPTGFSTYQP